MKSFTKLIVVASVACLAAATPAPQLGGLPALPVCLTGTLTGSLPTGLNLVSCSAGQKCTSPTDILNSIPILGGILGGILANLPAGVGLCA